MPAIALWAGVLALFIIGLMGIAIPALPGIGFIFAGILLYAWATGFATISVPTVIILGVIGLLAVGMDYMGSAVGARWGGGKTKALIGTIVGAIVGMTFSPIGIFIGAFLGGLAGALLEGQSSDKALKVALFSVIGVIGSSFMQFVLGLTMIVTFLVALFV